MEAIGISALVIMLFLLVITFVVSAIYFIASRNLQKTKITPSIMDYHKEYRRLDDLLNYLRATSEDATVTDRKFRSVFDRETVDLNSSLDDLMEKPKRRLMIGDDGEINEREYRGRHD